MLHNFDVSEIILQTDAITAYNFLLSTTPFVSASFEIDDSIPYIIPTCCARESRDRSWLGDLARS